MKKLLFAFITTLCSVFVLKAQVTHDTGLTTLTNPAAGGRTLEIRKDNDDAFMTFHDPGNYWYTMGLQQSTGVFKLGYGGDMNVNPYFVMNSLGKIGIGTADPKNTLSIAGVMNVEANGDYYGAWFGGEARTSNPSLNLGGWWNQSAKIYWHSNDRSLVFDTRNNSDLYPNTLVLRHGNVGIGTSSPGAKLDITGTQGSALEGIHIEGDNPVLRFIDNSNVTGEFVVFVNDGELRIAVDNAPFPGNYLNLTNNGHLGIGTTSPTEKLEVNGTIRSKKVKVEATGWPDYVFEDSYRLMAISKLERYIKQNKHLPEVPSAKEIETRGQDLGEIQTILLKKVEELTLYVLELESGRQKLEIKSKKIEARNRKLEADNATLKDQHEELKAVLFELKQEIETIKNRKP